MLRLGMYLWLTRLDGSEEKMRIQVKEKKVGALSYQCPHRWPNKMWPALKICRLDYRMAGFPIRLQISSEETPN